MVNLYYWISKNRKAFALMIVGCLLGQGLRAQTLGANIIVNGDAEDAAVVGAGKKWIDGGAGATTFGDASGTDGGVWFLTNTGTYPQPYGAPMRASNGNQFFNAGVNSALGDTRTLTQDIPVSAFAGQDIRYTFDGDIAGGGIFATQYDTVAIMIEYRNVTDDDLYIFNYSLTPTGSGPTGWIHVNSFQDVAATDLVTYVRITLTAQHENSSSSIQAYFDNLNLVGNSINLPVTLVDFHALQQPDHTVALQWETAQEQNSKYTEVQRSADGKSYLAIGQVAAAGNSSLPRDYAFNDQSPLSGRGFYRLKMVDIDGSFTYSKILQVTAGAAGTAIKVYSNPFHDQLGVVIPALTSEKLVLSLFDQTGRICLRQNYTTQKGNNFVNLYPGGMAAGVYLLHVQGAQTNETIRVLKQ